MSAIEKLEAIANTLATMDMKPTFENVNKMAGIYAVIREIQDELREVPDDAGEAEAD